MRRNKFYCSYRKILICRLGWKPSHGDSKGVGNRTAGFPVLQSHKNECARCGVLESDPHLFLRCSFARVAWFTSSFGLRTDFFDNNYDPSKLSDKCYLLHTLKLICKWLCPSFGWFGRLAMIFFSIKNLGLQRRCFSLPRLFLFQAKRMLNSLETCVIIL